MQVATEPPEKPWDNVIITIDISKRLLCMILNSKISKLIKNLKVNKLTVNSKISRYNPVYKAIDDYSYLVPYLAVSTAGITVFGIKGVFAGLGVSMADDFLIYNNYFKSKSLTHSFIGLTLGYNVYPSWVSGVIGMLGGISFSQGILKNYHNEISHLLATAMLGARINGLSGALVGSISSITDQILAQNNITNKYYLSHSLLGVASSSSIFGKSIFSNSAGVVLGLILTNCANISTSPPQSIGIGRDLYKIFLRVIPRKELDNYFKEYAIVLLSLQIAISQLRIAYLRYDRDTMYQFEHMNEPNTNAIHKLTTIIIKFGLFLFPYVITEFISNILNSFFSTKIYIEVDDAFRSILFTNKTALNLSLDKNNTVLIDNLKDDSKIISREGSNLIIDSITKLIQGMYSISILTVNAPEMLVYSLLYNKVAGYIYRILADNQSKYEVLIKIQESIISSLLKHDMNNIKIITETSGITYSYEQLQFEYNKLRESELIKDQISHLMNAWKSFESIASFYAVYYFVGYKLGKGTINFENRIKVFTSGLQVSRLLAWNGEKSQEIKTFYQSLERLNDFLDKALSSNYENIHNIKKRTMRQ